MLIIINFDSDDLLNYFLNYSYLYNVQFVKIRVLSILLMEHHSGKSRMCFDEKEEGDDNSGLYGSLIPYKTDSSLVILSSF